MRETAGPQTRSQYDHITFHEHDDCELCTPSSVSTSHLGAMTRNILDAMGDVRFYMTRSPEAPGAWRGVVEVYSVDAPAGADAEIEHHVTVGVPSFMSPNCPEWLWVMYVALGDMCSHFMDLHDIEVMPEADITAAVEAARG
jgi:hypothetical protein